jgi:hypothetical protein
VNQRIFSDLASTWAVATRVHKVAKLNGARPAEQWIEEGKQAVKQTQLSCNRFHANEARLWLS